MVEQLDPAAYQKLEDKDEGDAYQKLEDKDVEKGEETPVVDDGGCESGA
jgi:hypothetical protein